MTRRERKSTRSRSYNGGRNIRKKGATYDITRKQKAGGQAAQQATAGGARMREKRPPKEGRERGVSKKGGNWNQMEGKDYRPHGVKQRATRKGIILKGKISQKCK